MSTTDKRRQLFEAVKQLEATLRNRLLHSWTARQRYKIAMLALDALAAVNEVNNDAN